MERFAPRYDPLAFTTAEMAAAFVGFAVDRRRGRPGRGSARRDRVGRADRDGRLRERVRVPRAGVGAAADERERTALVFALEPVFAGIFGFALAGDRLGALGWAGCAVIMCGIAVAEPAAGGTLVRLVRRS